MAQGRNRPAETAAPLRRESVIEKNKIVDGNGKKEPDSDIYGTE